MLRRACRVSLNFATASKRRKIHRLLEAYRGAVNFYVRSLWRTPGKLDGETLAKKYYKELILLFVDGAGNHRSDELEIPANIIMHLLPPYSPELNPQENIWDEIREKIFKNYALKSMSDVNTKLDEASLYIERSRTLVKSIASFPYIAKSY